MPPPSHSNRKRERKATATSWLYDLLVCPEDSASLEFTKDYLYCTEGHSYPLVEGVPILLNPSTPIEVPLPRQPLGEIFQAGNQKSIGQSIDPYVLKNVAATNGNMFLSVVGSLMDYPIPNFPLPFGNQKMLLDIGCNWGRWSIAASRRGYQVIGLDPNPEAIFAAMRVAKKMKVDPIFVVADARHLPFKGNSFDFVFSYSVLQHFSKPDVRKTLSEIHRVLTPGGNSQIEMANKLGLRSLYHQARKLLKKRMPFDVSYWGPNELLETYNHFIGPSRLEVDGFLSLNPQEEEAHILPRRYRWIVRFSKGLKRISHYVGPLQAFADSLYICSRKEKTP